MGCPRVGRVWVTWREAMRSALYGPGGFYSSGEAPARHFRTSAHISPRFADALLAVLRVIDAGLGQPARLDLVDVGAGRGELLSQMLTAADADPALAGRIAVHAIEVVPRPDGLDPRIRWGAALPGRVTGLVIANEWLDNIPVDVAESTPAGTRLLLVDPASGAERPGPPPSGDDLSWLRDWWPLRRPGDRAEIGWPRCRAWADVIRRLDRGVAIAADYGHRKADRPCQGTLAGYQRGRAVRAIPDGGRDITAHVALDACADAGRRAGATATLLTTQREALRGLGVTGRRPPLAMAFGDLPGYAAALQRAGGEAELIDPGGLGAFGWLVQTAGLPVPAPLAAGAAALN